MKLFSCGDVHVSTVIEREGPQRKTQELFPSCDHAKALQYFREIAPYAYLPGSDRIYNTYQSFIVRVGGRVIMIDTCVGENKPRPRHFFNDYPKKPWLDNLAAEGLSVDDIDIVICTHLHVDHTGWNTTLVNGRFMPTFPKAQYVFGRAEYEYWEQQTKKGYEMPARVWTDSCLPVVTAGRAQLVETNHDFGNGIWLSPSPGHTPGHFCVNLRAGSQHVMFVGDVMHHPIQCREPRWSSSFCEDPDLAGKTRRALLEEVADTGIIVVPEHFPFPTAGRINRQGSSFRYDFLPSWWEREQGT